ncbi:glycosyltransferase [Priestia megaterium]|uniref:glycosyltransferase n=1 Tax=Priestia megaterium TaxID=1404 RepID=UPI000BA60D75|nr:glycosyltransferase [Priestia megaterium]PAK49089.1 hypothetical protein CHH47_14285 [Priestia megaterium]PEZ12509.1 hypothetical protein CN330_10240 [Priestia megaterium]
MKIIVNATANDSRGPLSVTMSFLKELNENQHFLETNKISLYVIVSHPTLLQYSSNNIEILLEKFPKKSVFHKFLYERFILPKKINEENFDAYLSLQNLGISHIAINQYVLVQTSLPIANINFSEISPNLYIKYRIFLLKLFRRELSKYTAVFVQTKWMKEGILDKCKKIDNRRVMVIKPPANDIFSLNDPLPTEILNKLQKNSHTTKLIYPTNQDSYKNNEFLIEGIKKYNGNASEKVTLYLTVEGEDTEYIKFLGRIPYSSMYLAYLEVDALVFSSLTETVGLPLVEAQNCGLPCIVADLPYAQEVCGTNGFYFDPRSINSFVNALKKYLNEKDNFSSIVTKYDSESYLSYIDHITKDLRKNSTSIGSK